MAFAVGIWSASIYDKPVVTDFFSLVRLRMVSVGEMKHNKQNFLSWHKESARKHWSFSAAVVDQIIGAKRAFMDTPATRVWVNLILYFHFLVAPRWNQFEKHFFLLLCFEFFFALGFKITRVYPTGYIRNINWHLRRDHDEEIFSKSNISWNVHGAALRHSETIDQLSASRQLWIVARLSEKKESRKSIWSAKLCRRTLNGSFIAPNEEWCAVISIHDSAGRPPMKNTTKLSS